ncbi:hypothetical protein P7C73_g1117, partial [Tremellales sp. Uapishka_1]
MDVCYFGFGRRDGLQGPPRIAVTAFKTLRTLSPSQTSQLRRLNTITKPFPEKLAFAFDIDGVLKQGHHNILPQAKRVLRLLSGADGTLAKPIPFLLMTNGGGVPDAERRAALSSELGVEIGENQLVQSHTPVQQHVHRYADKPVLVIGGTGEACRRVAESYGLKHAYIPQDIIAWNPAVWDRTALTTEEEAFVKRGVDFSQTPLHAIFVLHDTRDWGRDAMIICELLSSKGGVISTQREDRRKQKEGGEIPLLFTNPDLEWRSDYPLSRFGMGAFRLSVESIYKATTGLELPYLQYGKPQKATYAFAEEMLRRDMKRLGRDPSAPLNVYMVGDNPESGMLFLSYRKRVLVNAKAFLDIAGANNHGWNSILLRTGVYSGGTPTHRPTTIADDVEMGVLWAIERELTR